MHINCGEMGEIMLFTIMRNDITKLKVGAIVNAANTSLQMCGGACGAIFKAAGASELQAACDKLAPIKAGEAIMTSGFKLSAKYIIHTAGPVYHGGKESEDALLRSCYMNSLKIAANHNCQSIAFSLISSGIYGYPKNIALRIATDAILDFLSEHDMNITLAVFNREALSVSEKLWGAVDRYTDEHYVAEHHDSSRSLLAMENSYSLMRQCCIIEHFSQVQRGMQRLGLMT